MYLCPYRLVQCAHTTDVYPVYLWKLTPSLLLSGVFDVVIMVGGLDAGFAPVGVVRELCHAAKPGNRTLTNMERH